MTTTPSSDSSTSDSSTTDSNTSSIASSATSQPDPEAPIYQTISELFDHGFSLDGPIITFVAGIHIAAIAFAVWLLTAAPGDWATIAFTWAIAHFFIGSTSITLYNHRLITHSAAKEVSTPVHLFFCLFGQILGVQGSVKSWAANHSLHHGVDRNGKTNLDPYSATWFPQSWRNFIWSHTLTHLYNHPDSEERTRSHSVRRHPVIMWQNKWYGLLTTFWLFLFPMGLGFALGGFTGFFALLGASMIGSVLVQHNTWTVNSVTHMWGFTKGLRSSARNNYLWLGPMGEGNHHGDHHDFPRDFRNGFGVSGWLLDPTRYGILLLRGLGLVKGLNRASHREEVELLATRKLQAASTRVPGTAEAKALYEQLRSRVEVVKQDWVDAVTKWEALKRESKLAKQMNERKLELTAELQQARQRVIDAKEQFLDSLDQLRRQSYAT